MSYLFTNNQPVSFSDAAVDAFGQLKTVSPFTLFDSQHRYKDNGKWDTLVVEGGTASHNATESSVKLQIGRTAGSKVVRQTRRVFAYQPGKSITAINTFAMGGGKANLFQRVGFFDDQNGIFLEKGGFYGNELYLVLRSYVTGVTVDTKIPQGSWNTDKFNGTGPSGFSLDTTKANIFWTDIEWLGVGSVRCGFYVDGRPVIAHSFHNANANPTTYMTTACLPLRYEIFNTNQSGSGSTLTQICSTVISQGGYEARSTRHHVGVGLTAAAAMKTLTDGGIYYPVLSIRLNSNRINSIVVPSQLNIIAGTKSIYHYRLLLNANLNTPSWVSHENGTVEWDKSTTTFSGGTEINSGIFSETSQVTVSAPSDFNYQLGKTVGGTADTLTLVVCSQGQNNTIAAELGWEELV